MEKLNEWYARSLMWMFAHPKTTFVVIMLLLLALYVGLESTHGH